MDRRRHGAENKIKRAPVSGAVNVQRLEIAGADLCVCQSLFSDVFHAVFCHLFREIQPEHRVHTLRKSCDKSSRPASDIRHIILRTEYAALREEVYRAVYPFIPFSVAAALLLPRFRPLVPHLCRVIRPVRRLGFLHGDKIV